MPAGWHQKNAQWLQIDLIKNRRRRDGFDQLLHSIPGMLDNNKNFVSLDQQMAKYIRLQSSKQLIPVQDQTDHHTKEVQLIFEKG